MKSYYITSCNRKHNKCATCHLNFIPQNIINSPKIKFSNKILQKLYFKWTLQKFLFTFANFCFPIPLSGNYISNWCIISFLMYKTEKRIKRSKKKGIIFTLEASNINWFFSYFNLLAYLSYFPLKTAKKKTFPYKTTKQKWVTLILFFLFFLDIISLVHVAIELCKAITLTRIYIIFVMMTTMMMNVSYKYSFAVAFRFALTRISIKRVE